MVAGKVQDFVDGVLPGARVVQKRPIPPEERLYCRYLLELPVSEFMVINEKLRTAMILGGVL